MRTIKKSENTTAISNSVGFCCVLVSVLLIHASVASVFCTVASLLAILCIRVNLLQECNRAGMISTVTSLLHTTRMRPQLSGRVMGWLRIVGSLKLQVSFAEYQLFDRALLQKRLIILRSLPIVAAP